MPKVHFVKSARKSIPHIGVVPGDSYYWWQMRSGRGSVLRQSKSYPKRSQLTLSEYKSAAYSLIESFEEAIGAASDIDGLRDAQQAAIDEASSLKDEVEGNLSNMPDQLQDSDSGMLLQERISNLETFIDELEYWDDNDYEDEYGDGDLTEDELEEKKSEWLDEKKAELQAIELEIN